MKQYLYLQRRESQKKIDDDLIVLDNYIYELKEIEKD